MLRRFEYAIHRLDLGAPTVDNRWGDVELLSALNALGSSGWEVIRMTSTITKGWVLLKREINLDSMAAHVG
jgi:hypothetical protein